jgi:hypothetical protein
MVWKKISWSGCKSCCVCTWRCHWHNERHLEMVLYAGQWNTRDTAVTLDVWEKITSQGSVELQHRTLLHCQHCLGALPDRTHMNGSLRDLYHYVHLYSTFLSRTVNCCGPVKLICTASHSQCAVGQWPLCAAVFIALCIISSIMATVCCCVHSTVHYKLYNCHCVLLCS